MYCIPPTKIDQSKVVSGSGFSSIPEPDAARGEVEWVTGQAVTKDTVRIKASLHRKYRAIADMTAGDNNVSPESAPTKWQDIGATNKYSMYELNRNSSSKAITQIVATVAPGKRINSVFLGGVVGGTVKLEILDAANTLIVQYDYVLSSRVGVSSWSQYFFGEFENTPSVFQIGIPPVSGVKIRVTITSFVPGVEVALASFIVGNAVYMGEIQWQPESDTQNFSKIERSFDGELQDTNLIRRRNVPQLSLRLNSPKDITNTLRKLRDDLNASPAVWTGLDENIEHPYYESLLIFGIYRQFKINLKFLDWTEVTLLLEEM